MPRDNDTSAVCPACQERTLGDHCASPTCTWYRCHNIGCLLIICLHRRRGVMPIAGYAGQYRPVLLIDDD